MLIAIISDDGPTCWFEHSRFVCANQEGKKLTITLDCGGDQPTTITIQNSELQATVGLIEKVQRCFKGGAA